MTLQIHDGSLGIKLSSIRVHVSDGHDEQVWIQSSLSNTHKLPRGTRDDFSFGRKDLIVIPNISESECVTISIECLKAAESGLVIGSNRRGSRALREGEIWQCLMRPKETLTVRSYDAVEPVGSQDDGSPVRIRPGQNVVA